VASARCQRCHDPAAAGRLANAAHVYFGSRDPARAAAAPDLACAGCHVEHRGRERRLAAVDEGHCVGCHASAAAPEASRLRRFSGHPEFAALRAGWREAPGLRFGHGTRDPARFQGHVAELAEKRGVPHARTCALCHERDGGDFAPLSFERHCASCHAREGSLGASEALPRGVVLGPQDVPRGIAADWPAEEFDQVRDRLVKTRLDHRDAWLLYNLRALRRDADPTALAGARGRLLGRRDDLARRMALVQPLAGLDEQALEARARAVELEVRGVEGRLGALGGAKGPGTGLARVAEVLSAAEAAGDPLLRDEARALVEGGAGLDGAPPAALPPVDHAARRDELIALLDAVEAADPAARHRAEDLRRRLLALSPGEASAELLARVRGQRRAAAARVADEIALRRSGVAPPAEALLDAERQGLERARQEVEEELADLAALPERGGSLAPEERERRAEAARVLAAPCLKCHLADGLAFARVRAARPVLVRARFSHAPHLLQADCARCHPTAARSAAAEELSFRGVASCRECHRTFGVRQDCQSCHRYHPPPAP
jgi:hypothetical protein